MNKRMFMDARQRFFQRADNDELEEVGWEGGESFVQLELKSPDAVSPEMRAIMDQMHINALRREAALRSHFEKRLAATAAQSST